MGRRKYPPLTQSQVIAILGGLGFTKVREEGSHAHFEAPASESYPRSIVTVDTGYREFDETRIKTMIRQSNRPREMFYGATKGTARKAFVQRPKLTPDTAKGSTSKGSTSSSIGETLVLLYACLFVQLVGMIRDGGGGLRRACRC